MPTRRQCKRALDTYEKKLSKLKSVVGLGIINLDKPRKEKQSAIAVYVKEVIDKDSLPEDQQIPEFVTIPGRGKAKIKIPVEIIEQGEVELESPPNSDSEPLGKEPLP